MEMTTEEKMSSFLTRVAQRQPSRVALRFARFCSTPNLSTDEERNEARWDKIRKILNWLVVTKVVTYTAKKCYTIVPEGSAFIVERMGKYAHTLSPGPNGLIPLVDKVAYVHSLKVKVFKISNFHVTTVDNASFMIEGVLFLKIVDPKLASYEIDNALERGVQFAETVVRNQVGLITVNATLYERTTLNRKIMNAINTVAKEDWGVECIHFEIRDTTLPSETIICAQSKKVAQILHSEAEREIEIISGEAKNVSKICGAQADATALLFKAQGTANHIGTLSRSLIFGEASERAVKFVIARQFIDALGKIFEKANVIVLPPNHEEKEEQEPPK